MMSLTVSSKSFLHEGLIPKLFTCDGRNISPPLDWEGVPKGAASLCLVVDDPDAPDPAAPKMTWNHWILYNISPSINGIEEGIPIDNLPSGALQGLNDWHRKGYGGPCPPVGLHRYFFKLYALNIVLPDLQEPTKSKLEKEMQGHIIRYGELIGKYKRQNNNL